MGTEAFFLRTSPRLVRVTVLISSVPDQIWSSWSPTWTSTLAPAWETPRQICCQDTQMTPLAETLRFTQSLPRRLSRALSVRRSRSGCDGVTGGG